MRKKIVAGNWKMNTSGEEALSLFSEIVQKSNHHLADEILIFPPSLYLQKLSEINPGLIKLGAQNCHFEDTGAFTGEVSAMMLKSIGATHCLVGHSERRQYFGESDQIVTKKFDTILNTGLVPILCVGETLEERNNGTFKNIVSNQLKAAVKKGTQGEFIIAYEPVWAIGTGKTASAEQAQEMHALLRSSLVEIVGEKAHQIPILYGGSCNPLNARELFGMEDIDGGLIGGASLNADSFIEIANAWD